VCLTDKTDRRKRRPARQAEQAARQAGGTGIETDRRDSITGRIDRQVIWKRSRSRGQAVISVTPVIHVGKGKIMQEERMGMQKLLQT
jgi:hypothetical protein